MYGAVLVNKTTFLSHASTNSHFSRSFSNQDALLENISRAE